MSRRIFGAAAAALVGAVCLVALYGPAFRAPAPAAAVAVAPAASAPAAPADLRGRIPAPAAPVVLAEVASTPAAAPPPPTVTAQAPEAVMAAPRPHPARVETAAPAAKVAAAPASEGVRNLSRTGSQEVRQVSGAVLSPPESRGSGPAPVRTETVVVQAPRVAAAPPPIPLDRMGRGNSVTISLPRKSQG